MMQAKSLLREGWCDKVWGGYGKELSLSQRKNRKEKKGGNRRTGLDALCGPEWSGNHLSGAFERRMAGKIAAGVELFYLEIVRQPTENKRVKNGLELAPPKSVGEANRGSL
jgi:hypothetical protein